MRVFIFFSHKLLPVQEIELKNNYFCKEILQLPSNLRELWSNIDENNDHFQLFKEFLEKNSKRGDYILIQGEWGITYKMVNYSKQIGLTPIYSFAKRRSKEIIQNNEVIKISYFEHIKFKKYE